MIINDNTFSMLLTHKFLEKFTKKTVADATKTTEVLIALSLESREQVDEFVDTALKARQI